VRTKPRYTVAFEFKQVSPVGELRRSFSLVQVPSVMTTNVREYALTMKDGAQFRGQVLGEVNPVPHGFGRLTTEDGFVMTGYFTDGKAHGPGVFCAPNGDEFFGHWNREHKRHGQGLAVKSDGKQLVETYDDGKRTKCSNRRLPPRGFIQWTRSLPVSPASPSSPPCARSGHTATSMADGAMVVVFGGQKLDEECRLVTLNDLHIFDVEAGEWMEPEFNGTPPPPLYGHSATAVGSQLVVIGGQHGMEVSSSVYVLETQTGTWHQPITKGIHFINHTATLLPSASSSNPLIYVIVQSSVYVLECGIGGGEWRWKECQVDMRGLRMSPRALLNHTAVAVGSDIYVFGGKIMGGGLHNQGGKRYDQCSSELRILHTDSMAWEIPAVKFTDDAKSSEKKAVGGAKKADYSGIQLGNVHTPRSEHTACVVGNRMYVVGGWTSVNPAMNVVDVSYLDDVHVLDLSTLTWSSPLIRAPFNPPRGSHSACVIAVPSDDKKDGSPDVRIMVFGGRNFAHDALDAITYLCTGEDERVWMKQQARLKAQTSAGTEKASTSSSSSLPSKPASSASSATSLPSSASSSRSAPSSGVGANKWEQRRAAARP